MTALMVFMLIVTPAGDAPAPTKDKETDTAANQTANDSSEKATAQTESDADSEKATAQTESDADTENATAQTESDADTESAQTEPPDAWSSISEEAREQIVEVIAGATEQVSANNALPRYRVDVAVGSAVELSDSAEWFEGFAQPSANLRVARSADDLVSGLSFHLGASANNQGTAAVGSGELTLLALEVEGGVAWQFPRRGLWDRLFPYVRGSALLSYWRVRSGERLGADLVVPGVEGTAGLRVHLGKLQVNNSGDVKGGRLFLFGEGGLAWRLPSKVVLERLDEDEDDPNLPGPGTRLGELDLSSWSWRVGVGVVF